MSLFRFLRQPLGAVLGFWLLVGLILGARVALFDEIEGARGPAPSSGGALAALRPR